MKEDEVLTIDKLIKELEFAKQTFGNLPINIIVDENQVSKTNDNGLVTYIAKDVVTDIDVLNIYNY